MTDDNSAGRRAGRGVAIVLAALAGAVVSTVAQLALWWLSGDAWLELLFRDARLAAAIVLGERVLSPLASVDPSVMMVAAIVHCALSLAYATVVAALIERQTIVGSVLTGAGFGLALYVVNLYGFTAIFPWFAAARGLVTVAAHVAFGVSAALAYRWGGAHR
jgi:hypothetical protein